MKKVKILLSVIILLLTMTNSFAVNYDFPKNEDYYAELCSSPKASSNRAACLAYQDYVNQKVIDSQNELQKLIEDIKNLQGNISAMAKKVSTYQTQISDLEAEITRLQKSITDSEATIVTLTAQIAEREIKVTEIDAAIRLRMVSMQSFVSLNSYVDFIMGANDFSDLIRRVEGINEITAYDKSLMVMLAEEIAALNNDKAEVESQKALLLTNKANVESNQATAVQLKVAVEKILVEYRKQQDLLEKNAEYLAADIKETQAILKQIAAALKSVIASPGWILPLKTRFRVSAVVWAYPEGGVHLGIDLAATIGSNLYAVGNGVVIYSANACPTYGYLGNRCGAPGAAGFGNQVHLIVAIGTSVYAITYGHLMQNTALKTGTIVNQGDLIGKMGTSGSSTGSHVHVEIKLLGIKSMSYYVENWTGDLSFGTKWGSTGLAYRCDYNGHKAPCRETPQNIFNVGLYGSYN